MHTISKIWNKIVEVSYRLCSSALVLILYKENWDYFMQIKSYLLDNFI